MKVDVHNNLGDLWRAQGQLGRQEAQRCYQEALRLEQGYAPAWRGLGDIFREAGDHSNAVACYQVLPKTALYSLEDLTSHLWMSFPCLL